MMASRWILEFIVEFFNTSSIHGFNHLAAKRRHPLEVLAWLFLVLLGMYGASILSALTLTRYRENPTVISMERDRFSWNTSFPGATICPTTKLSDRLLDEYVERSSAKNKTALRDFLVHIANASYDNFENVPNYDDMEPEKWMDVILDLQFEFKPSVSNSGANGNQYALEKVITELGVCYTYNSQMAVYSSQSYLKENRWDVLPENSTFYVNPLDGEVFANVVNMSTGFAVQRTGSEISAENPSFPAYLARRGREIPVFRNYLASGTSHLMMILHGPYEVADVASKMLRSPNGYFLQVYLTALHIYSSDRARGLNINQRRCRYYDESNLEHSPVYSFVLCRTECRLKLAKKLCGCVPHFYRRLPGEKVCNVEGLHCLAGHKERLISLKKECNCYTNCDEVNYIVVQVDSREWFLGSNLQWGLKEYPRMRLKRDVLFGFTDLLVYIGGMTGLFFGCSVLSFIEIFYFFTLRFFWYIVNFTRNRKSVA